MSYGPQYQYGPPQGQQYGAPSPQPPPNYGGPPPNNYYQPSAYPQGPPQGYPPGPPQGYSQAYPPQQPGFAGPPPAQGYLPPGAPPPQSGYSTQPAQQAYQPYNQQNFQQNYNPQPQQNYGTPPPQGYQGQAPGPSEGYGAWIVPPGYDASLDADACRKAMKGFGTNEGLLIDTLANKTPTQVSMIRDAYHSRHKRNLLKDIKSETSGYFEEALCALVRGPLLQDCHVLHSAMCRVGTKESDLNDVLLSRSNADMRAIKETYRQEYGRSLEADLKGDLSMKTERHFMMVVAGNRAEGIAPTRQQVDQDVMELYKATEAKIGTDEILVCSILTNRNDDQIRAIEDMYYKNYNRHLESVIAKEFSGHMESALLHQLRGAVDRAKRDAILLESSMMGMGTQDHKLVHHVIRAHWDPYHLAQVKGAYKVYYSRALEERVRGETSGDYQRVMLACLRG